MKKLIFLFLIAGLARAQQIPNGFFGINHWMPLLYLNDQSNPAGAIESPTFQQMVQNQGAIMYRIGGNGYDKKGNAIGPDEFSNDYIRAMKIIRTYNANSKFLVQVPYKAAGFTADSAFRLVSNIRNAFPGEDIYYSIGNEWDRYTYSNNRPVLIRDIAGPIKSFAIQIRRADTVHAKIVAPSLSFFSATDSLGHRIMDTLLTNSEANCIAGLIQNSGFNFLNNRFPYIDVVNFHSYGGSNTNLYGATNWTAFNNAKYGLINNSSQPTSGFAKNLDDLITLLNAANASRTSNPLSFAITEMNVCSTNQPRYPTTTSAKYRKTSEGLSARSFFAGQNLASIMATALEKGTKSGNPKVEFVMPWAIHESGGNGDSIDLGITKGPGTAPIKLSTYHHYQLMAQHFYGRFQSGTVTTTQAPAVRSFASIVDDAGIYVMILNRDSVGYTFAIDFQNNTPTTGTVKLKYDVPTTQLAFDTASTYPSVLHPTLDSIGPNTTVLLLFNCHGRKYFKKQYSLEKANNDEPPALKQVGDRDVAPDFQFCETVGISGDISSDVTYKDGTYYVVDTVTISSGAKLTFDNAFVVMSPGVLIKGGNGTSIEVKNGSLLFGCNGPWEGLQIDGNSGAEQLHVENSYIYEARHPIKTDQVPDIYIKHNYIANGITAIGLQNSQVFDIEENVIGQFDTGVETSNTLPGYSSTIKSNEFIEMGTGMTFNNDDHSAIDISCNIINFNDYGIYSTGTALNNFGNTSLSAGNTFLNLSGTPSDFIYHTGSSTTYYEGPNEAAAYSGLTVMNISQANATTDNLCAISRLLSFTCKDYLLFTGVKEKNNIEGVKVYPNPSSGRFNVSAGNQKYTLSVYDMLGRKVLAKSVTGEDAFEISAKGFYIVTLDNEKGVKSAKVIVD